MVVAEVAVAVVAEGGAATATAVPPPSAADADEDRTEAAAGAGEELDAPAMPVTKERYPGTNGRQHGERKVTAPAAAATGSARISGPEVTSWAAPLMCPLCHAGPGRSTKGYYIT